MTLLNYWKTNQLIRATLKEAAGTNHIQLGFIRRPAESGVTYHVQASTDLSNWVDIASYAGTNIVLTPQAVEISRTGSLNELVTVQETLALANQTERFLRVNVTRP